MVPVTEESAPPLFDIGATLGVLWARKLVVLGIALAVLLAALAYLSVTKPVYTATATILLDPRDSHATGFDTVLSGIGADSAAIASQVSVIASTDLLSDVFNEEGLATDPELTRLGLISRLLGRSPPNRDAAFANFRSRVVVEREGLTYVIDISFKSTDRDKAARIVNAIVAGYKATLSGEKEGANSKANDLLTGKVGELQKAVSAAEMAVQNFKFQNHIFDASAGGSLQSQIDQFSTQLVAAQDQADQADVKYRQAVAAGTGPEGLARLSKILSSNTTDKLRDDYNQRAAAMANSRVVLGPKHPTIARLSAELAGIRELMSSEAVRITEELKAQRDIAAQNVGQIQAKLDELRQRGNVSDLAQVQLRQLQRQADAARAVLDDFLKRSQETLHMEGMQISQLRVISDAVPPLQATWPKPTLVLMASTVLGFMLGCAIALLMGPPKPVSAGRPAEPSSRRGVSLGRLPKPAMLFARNRNLADFGTFKVPAASSHPPQGSVLAAGPDDLRPENIEFLKSVDRLVAEVSGKLQGTAKPFVLRVSALRDGPERRLAALMVGMGLERARQRVLVIDVAAPQSQASRRNGDPLASALPFTDRSSGLRMISVKADAMDATATAHIDDTLGRLLMRSGGAVDFLLVIDRALDEPDYAPALASRADLSVFAFGPAEWKSGAASRLGRQLPAAAFDNSATLVIEIDAAQPTRGGARARETAAASSNSRHLAAMRG